MSADVENATASTIDYPLGQHTWRLKSVNNFDGDFDLSLDSCHDDTEFNCVNGMCVPIEQRCDGRDDCGDASDEDDCHKV